MTEGSERPWRSRVLFAIIAGAVMVLSALAVTGGAPVGTSRATATVTTSQVPASTPVAPASTALFVLFSVYNSRPDLQAAFPNATTNSSNFTGLLDWAGGVVIHEFPDSAYATLAPFGYLYALMVVYNQRTDLQTAFPGVTTELLNPGNDTEYARLVDWAGGVVTGKWSDSASPVLDLYGYYYDLMMVYDGRFDLQAAFPDALENQTPYESLVDWAGGVVTGAWNDSANSTLTFFGYYFDLMMVYDGRSDLQTAFPNAYEIESSYEDLLEWADEVVTGVLSDSDYSTLALFETTYMALAPSTTEPIGTAFAAGFPVSGKCPGTDTFAANGCTGGDYFYTLDIETSIVGFDNVLFEVRTSSEAAYSPAGPGGFSVLNIGGKVLVQTPIPGGSWMEMNSTFVFYAIGTWPETSFTSIDTIMLDMGTADPAGLGYSFVVLGTEGFTGTTSPVTLQ